MTATFDPDFLAQRLADLNVEVSAPLIGAVSGGADSLALAHALHRTGRRLRIVHVNHHLDPASDQWARHVSALAAQWGIACHVVDVAVADGPNLEARAREARYAAIGDQMHVGETVLTAHHQDDQALTLLLQLLRGAGPAGLAAMPARSAFGDGWLVRPLLEVRASALAGYAQREGLQPVVDPGNDTLRFERNYLHQKIAPLLRERWPAFDRTLARSAGLCAEANDLLRVLARIDGAAANRLNLDPARIVDEARARNALRGFLTEQGLPLPGRVRLTEYVRQVRSAGSDASPSLTIGKHVLRSFRQHVFVTPEHAPEPDWSAPLTPGQAVGLPGAGGVLTLSETYVGPALTVRLRRGGERFAGPPTRRVKTFLHGLGVLPWQRPWVPLVYADAALVAVGDWWQTRSLEAALRWERGSPFLLDEEEPGAEFAQPR